MKKTTHTPTVKDIVSACEYTGCKIVDQLGYEIPVTKENANEIYKKSVEHIDAVDNVVRIWTFDNLEKNQKPVEEFLEGRIQFLDVVDILLEGLNEEIKKHLRVNVV